MCRRVAQRIKPRTAIALIICAALPSMSSVPLSLTSAAQNQPKAREDKAKPKPGKPEGAWPDLNDVKEQSQIEREAPPPITGSIAANVMTAGNIIQHSQSIGQTYRQIAYNYGPGSTVSAQDNIDTRTTYADEAMRLKDRYAAFINCLKTGQ